MSVAVDDARVAAGSCGDVLGDPLGELRSALDALLAAGPGVLCDGDTLSGLLVEASRVEALVCREVAAFDRGGEWNAVGAQNAAAWITTRARCDRRVARRRVRLGRSLRWMDLVDEAFVAGSIGAEHVEVLARARDRSKATALAFGRDQALLVGWARTMKFHRFVREVEEWLEQVDAAGAEKKAAKQVEGRRFHLSQSFENCWFADGMFDPISGQIIHDVLERIERELFEADWAAAQRSLGRVPLVTELGRTAAQRRVDALVEMARRAETTPKNGRRPMPLFTVLMGADTFARTCELASGTIVTPGAVAGWLTEAVIERIVFDGPDRVVAVGHQRAFTGALRRAIEVRDRTCRHPYCDEPAEHCDIDHIDPYGLGGKTTQHNGRALCGFHNRLRNGDQPRKPDRFSTAT